ncbi:MAG: hypothetical protein KAS32_20910 [Candidatus Peribacteraceae bacterium]|nr:hypothetical protein [Candidatus Peribacteraceae bacterium]
MSFELLDTILESSNAKEAEVEAPFVAEDADVYGGLDSLVEDAMRDSLRFTVMESAVDSDTKIEHLGVVEGVAFTQEQMLAYMGNSIHPVLEMSGVLGEDVEETTPVHPAIYELALTLALNESKALPTVDDIYMESAEAFLDEMTAEDGVINDKKDQMSNVKYYGEKDGEGKGDDTTERDGDDEAAGENTPEIKEGNESLYDTIISEAATKDAVVEDATQEAKTEDTSDSNLAEHILDIFESYEIEDEDVRREVLEVASELYAEVGMEGLSISIIDTADIFTESAIGEGVINIVDLDEDGAVIEESVVVDEETPYLTVRFLEGQLNLLEAKRDKKEITKALRAKIAKAKAKMKGVGTRSYGAIGGKAAAAKFKLQQKVARYKGVAKAASGSAFAKTKAVSKAVASDVAAKAKAAGKAIKTKTVAAAKGTKFKASQVPEKLARKATQAGAKMKKFAGTKGGAALGAAAIATAATMAWRRRKDACSGLSGDAAGKCKKAAAGAALNAVKVQASKCTTDRCKASAKRQMDEWKRRATA